MIAAVRDAGGQPKYFEYFGVGMEAGTGLMASPSCCPGCLRSVSLPGHLRAENEGARVAPVARFPADAEFRARADPQHGLVPEPVDSAPDCMVAEPRERPDAVVFLAIPSRKAGQFGEGFSRDENRQPRHQR